MQLNLFYTRKGIFLTLQNTFLKAYFCKFISFKIKNAFLQPFRIQP